MSDAAPPGEEFVFGGSKTRAKVPRAKAATAGGSRMAHAEGVKREKTRVRVVIGGEEYVLRGDAPPEYIQQVAKIVDETFSRLQATYPNVPRHRVAILTAMHLADEIHRLRRETDELTKLLEEVK